MANNFQRPIITQGNDFYINITMSKLVDGDIENFDLSRCKSVEVYLVCSVHNTRIDLDFTIPQSEHNNVITAFVDHRMLHNTSYGICVEGTYEDDLHWRWYVQPREGILIIPNTSGQNIPVEIEYIDVAGRVGFGEIDLSDYYTKEETNTILESYATETELQDYQPTLVSGENIKTINNESILGEGNITIEAAEQQQADWNETDTTAPSYIQNKPDLSNYVQSSELATVATSGNYSDLNGTPTIPAAPVQSNWNESDTTSLAYIQNKPTIPAAQVQANWTESDTTSLAYIQNKPTINAPGFAQYTNNNKTGLVNTLSQYYNTNIGTGAVIEGDGTNDDEIEASGDYSHAEGRGNIASGDHSHAEGDYNTATGANAHAEGSYSIANGYHSHSEGYNTTADDTGSHSEGMYTQASGEASHAEGESTTASGDYSHAEGDQSIATNTAAHAEGYCTTASGIYGSHSEGYMTTASEEASHAEGYSTIASGDASHAEGAFTNAKNYAEHASGVFNTSLEAGAGAAFGSYAYTLFSVGNGTDVNNRHNAFDIRQNGDIYITDTSQIDNTSYFYYNAPMIKLQDALSGGGSTQVQANWNETDTTSPAYIQNKPIIPTNAAVDYNKTYLTLHMIDGGKFQFTISGYSYSTDNGQTWIEVTQTYKQIEVPAGTYVMFKGELTVSTTDGIGTLTTISSAKCEVMGNPMSLVYGDNFINKTLGNNYQFARLFYGNTGLISAEHLALPSNIKWYCYQEMFRGCTALITPPVLPATTLAPSCYYRMFRGCTSLTKAPALIAQDSTTSNANVYGEMFYDCTSLNYIYTLAQSNGFNSTQNWLYNVASFGTFVCTSKSIYTADSASGIPVGWNAYTIEEYEYAHNYQIPAAQVQANWNETDTTSPAYIQNKPTITTPDPSTGNAGQVLATNGTNYYFRNETEAMLISTSSGSTQTKRMSSSNIASLSMLQNQYFTVIISTDNTYVGEIKLRLYTDNTDTSGHTIYINGAVSSSTNYTLPKGSYTVYYDGTYYYFDTTGQIPFVPKSSTYNMKIEVVSALPVSPDSNTLYIVV